MQGFLVLTIVTIKQVFAWQDRFYIQISKLINTMGENWGSRKLGVRNKETANVLLNKFYIIFIKICSKFFDEHH